MQYASNSMDALVKALNVQPMHEIRNMNVIELPEPIMLLPREKPLPEPKPTTKWEKFAREKGIKKRKHSRLIWDEVSKSYKPR